MYSCILTKINLNLRSIHGFGVSAFNMHERFIPRKVCPLEESSSVHAPNMRGHSSICQTRELTWLEGPLWLEGPWGTTWQSYFFFNLFLFSFFIPIRWPPYEITDKAKLRGTTELITMRQHLTGSELMMVHSALFSLLYRCPSALITTEQICLRRTYCCFYLGCCMESLLEYILCMRLDQLFLLVL